MKKNSHFLFHLKGKVPLVQIPGDLYSHYQMEGNINILPANLPQHTKQGASLLGGLLAVVLNMIVYLIITVPATLAVHCCVFLVLWVSGFLFVYPCVLE